MHSNIIRVDEIMGKKTVAEAHRSFLNLITSSTAFRYEPEQIVLLIYEFLAMNIKMFDYYHKALFSNWKLFSKNRHTWRSKDVCAIYNLNWKEKIQIFDFINV